MKEPLKVGDRVRVYGSSLSGAEISGEIGIIKDLLVDDGWVNIKADSDIYTVHQKQLRRLKKKPRRELWVNEYEDGLGGSHYNSLHEAIDNRTRLSGHKCLGTIKFREVKENEKPF